MTTVITINANIEITATVTITTVCDEGEWWKTDGVEDEDVVGAWQAKGAGSYANSKLNLVDEETYELVDTGHAPDWDDTNGWKFDGISEYLATGFGLIMEQSWTTIIRFSNLVLVGGNFACIFGNDTGGMTYQFLTSGDGLSESYWNGEPLDIARAYTQQGIIAIGGRYAYRDGISDGLITNIDWSYPPITDMYIGCHDYSGDSPAAFANVYIQAFAAYNKTLTPTQIAAITDNMEAL